MFCDHKYWITTDCTECRFLPEKKVVSFFRLLIFFFHYSNLFQVAIQCLETVFKISPEDTHLAVSQPLTEMFTNSFCKVSCHCFLISIWFKDDHDNYVELLTFEGLGLYVTNFFLGVRWMVHVEMTGDLKYHF